MPAPGKTASIWSGGYGVFGTTPTRKAVSTTFRDTLLSALGESPILGTVKISNWDWAVYFQGTLEVTEWLSVTGGVRYTEEKKGLQRRVEAPNDPDPEGRADFSESKTFTNTSPSATVRLTAPESWIDSVPIDHIMTYFRYAEGFRGGGFQGNALFTPNPEDISFKPESNDSLEVGLKGILFDRKLSLSFAYFHDKLQDQQIPQFVTAEGAITGDVLITNAGQSTVQGVELEFATQPIEGLALNGSVGYLDAVYDEFENAQNARTGDPVDRSGQRFNFLPQWQTYLGAQYTIDTLDFFEGGPDWLAGTIVPRIDWSWQSKTTNWAPELPELNQNGFHLVNLRATYSFNDDRTQMAFFVNNVTDQDYFRDSVALGPRLSLVVGKYYEPPRWYGFEFSQSF